MKLLTRMRPSSGLFLNLTPSSSKRLHAASRSSTAMQMCPKPRPGSSLPLEYPLNSGSLSGHYYLPLCPSIRLTSAVVVAELQHTLASGKVVSLDVLPSAGLVAKARRIAEEVVGEGAAVGCT